MALACTSNILTPCPTDNTPVVYCRGGETEHHSLILLGQFSVEVRFELGTSCSRFIAQSFSPSMPQFSMMASRGQWNEALFPRNINCALHLKQTSGRQNRANDGQGSQGKIRASHLIPLDLAYFLFHSFKEQSPHQLLH